MSAVDTLPLGFEDNSAIASSSSSSQVSVDNNDPQGAYNPETGEINWDCPCLDGMAHGTCGEEFKAAFSCFIYSNEEEKGIDCVDNFRAMQDCFRAHPDEYGPQEDEPLSDLDVSQGIEAIEEQVSELN
ncbi:Mitochondrial intermembrane space import and assembly protein 40 [Smittium mucronatum]|uniref:Mitochondrial intermembrane space import and assembly protein 40 n=1 Tax=Smittium mucronatum TaxID=133383 RepID=A0A1R0GZW8_9FUNG|nr:Mitochondrial intermembrane space import and assembly protein 40 [Smittium mucronatum]